MMFLCTRWFQTCRDLESRWLVVIAWLFKDGYNSYKLMVDEVHCLSLTGINQVST